MSETDELRMSDPDNCERFSIQLDAATNNLCLARKASLPEAVTQHDDGVTAGNTVLFGCEKASEMCAAAKGREVVIGNEVSDERKEVKSNFAFFASLREFILEGS